MLSLSTLQWDLTLKHRYTTLFLIIFFTNPLCSGTAETLLVRTTPRLLQARVPGTPRTRSTQHCSTLRTHSPHTDNRNLSTRMHRLEKRDRQLQDTHHNHTTMALLRRFIFYNFTCTCLSKKEKYIFYKKGGNTLTISIILKDIFVYFLLYMVMVID